MIKTTQFTDIRMHYKKIIFEKFSKPFLICVRKWTLQSFIPNPIWIKKIFWKLFFRFPCTEWKSDSKDFIKHQRKSSWQKHPHIRQKRHRNAGSLLRDASSSASERLLGETVFVCLSFFLSSHFAGFLSVPLRWQMCDMTNALGLLSQISTQPSLETVWSISSTGDTACRCGFYMLASAACALVSPLSLLNTPPPVQNRCSSG